MVQGTFIESGAYRERLFIVIINNDKPGRGEPADPAPGDRKNETG